MTDGGDKKKLLRPAERKDRCEEYIKSDDFGADTWFTITAFNENLNNVTVTMRHYNYLLKYLDHGFLPAQFSDQQKMLRIKQQIVLDLILKAQIIVESSLPHFHS